MNVFVIKVVVSVNIKQLQMTSAMIGIHAIITQRIKKNQQVALMVTYERPMNPLIYNIENVPIVLANA